MIYINGDGCYNDTFSNLRSKFHNNLSYQELVIEIFEHQFKGRVNEIAGTVNWIIEELEDEYIWMCPRWKELAHHIHVPRHTDRRLVPISPEKFMRVVEEYVRVRDL